VYGPVRTVVWEGRSREAPPYPDRWPKSDPVRPSLERVRLLRCCGRTLARQESRNQLKGWDQATSRERRIGRY
jgi:hypothetical protein